MSPSSVRSQQIRNFIKELFILRRERLMRDTCISRTQITCRVSLCFLVNEGGFGRVQQRCISGVL